MWKSKNLKCRECDVLLKDLSDQDDTRAWLPTAEEVGEIKRILTCSKCERVYWIDGKNCLCRYVSKNEISFVRPPDWYCSQCDKGIIDRYESNFDGICDACYVGNHLEKIHPDILKFPNMALLDVNIKGCSNNIIAEDYMLLRIDKKTHDILNDLWLAFKFDFDANERFTSKGKYIFVANFEEYRIGGRGVTYLNNCFGDSLCFSDVILIAMSIVYKDWTSLNFKKGNTLNITLEGFRDCLTISKYTGEPSIDDIDVKLILEKINQNDRTHLFRGINKVYDENDGIASFNYRNNKNFVEVRELQEHEKEIADRFNRKQYRGDGTYIQALSISRHLGHDTSFIDFTEDPMVALYFACQKTDDTSTIAEVIYFDREILKEREEVYYPVFEDFVIRPTESRLIKERVRAQKSVFVYAYRGYLPRDEYQQKFHHLFIDPSLKPFLSKESGLCEDDIYPDELGFFDNPENFRTYAKLLRSAKMKINDISSDPRNEKYHEAMFILRECKDKYPENFEVDELIRICDEKLQSVSRRSS